MLTYFFNQFIQFYAETKIFSSVKGSRVATFTESTGGIFCSYVHTVENIYSTSARGNLAINIKFIYMLLYLSELFLLLLINKQQRETQPEISL